MNGVLVAKGVEQGDRGMIILEEACLDVFSGSIRAFFGEMASMVFSNFKETT